MGPLQADDRYRHVMEQTAWHESGHVVGYWAQDMPLAYVTMVGYGSQPRPHTQPVEITVGTRGQRVLAYASGVVTTLCYSQQELGDIGIVELLIGSADDRFEVMGRHTQTRTRLPRANYTSPGEDLGRIDPAVVTGQPFTVEKAINFWRDCERFIISVLPAVAAVSRSLISHGLLSGDEAASLASAAMQRQPPAWIPPWTAQV